MTDLRLGYRMAQNLRAKLPSSDNLIIYDVNSEAAAKFAKDNSNVEVAGDVRDVAEKSVS
jgi:malate/lactate dehydrogenase